MDSNKNMRRVIICDIDGTMIVHRTHLTNGQARVQANLMPRSLMMKMKR